MALVSPPLMLPAPLLFEGYCWLILLRGSKSVGTQLVASIPQLVASSTSSFLPPLLHPCSLLPRPPPCPPTLPAASTTSLHPHPLLPPPSSPSPRPTRWIFFFSPRPTLLYTELPSPIPHDDYTKPLDIAAAFSSCRKREMAAMEAFVSPVFVVAPKYNCNSPGNRVPDTVCSEGKCISIRRSPNCRPLKSNDICWVISAEKSMRFMCFCICLFSASDNCSRNWWLDG